MSAVNSHIKQTINLALPVAIGQLSHVMFGIVDSLMVGKVGTAPLAAASLVNSLVILVLVLGIGMSIAVTPLVAIAKGAEEKDKCGVLLRQSILVNGIFAILLVVLLFSMASIIKFLNQPEEVAVLAESYLKIISFSIFPFMLFQTYRQFIEGLSYTRPAMYINLSANLVNVFGNWIFIYGNLGSPAYGLDGAGYSTFITRTFMAAVMMYYVMKSSRFAEFNPTLRYRSINWKVIKQIINLGVPSGMSMFFEVGAFSFSAVMIGWLGSVQLAANQIAISIASASFMMILGIGTAATIRVGNALGRKDYENMRTAGLSAIVMGGAIMAFFGILFILFRDFLPTLFISDPAVVGAASALIVIAALFQISDGVQAVGIGALRGLTDVKIPMLITFIAYWVISLPVGYVLGFEYNLGVNGIWVGLLIGLTIAAIFFVIRFYSLSRRMQI